MEDEVVSIELDHEYDPNTKSLANYAVEIHDTLIDVTVSSKHTLDDAIQLPPYRRI